MFKKLITLSLIAVLLPALAMAQYYGGNNFSYRNSKGAARRNAQRTTIFFGPTFASATVTDRFRTDLDKTTHFFPPTDTTVTQKLNSKEGWSLQGETFFPLAKLTENSGLTLNIGIALNAVSFKVTPTVLGDSAKNITTDGDADGSSYGFMLGLDYRSGGDFSLDKEKRSMFAIGAGVYPSWSAMPYGPTNGVDVSPAKSKPFKMTPYFRVEYGFFAGIAFKIRASTYLGKPTYVDKYLTDKPVTQRHDYSVKGNSFGWTLGLVIMPYSWDWGNDGE